MRRFLAAHRPQVFLLVIVVAVGMPYAPGPRWLKAALILAVVALYFVRVPIVDHETRHVAAPLSGRWAALNSPGTKVPSHGTRHHGQTYAIDVLRPNPPGTRVTVPWRLWGSAAEERPSYGAAVHAVADGVVVATVSRQRDHLCRDTWPSLLYLMTVEAMGRELGGSRFILGNHVVLDHGGGVFSVCAHLRRGSVAVGPGDTVNAGDRIGEVGNSGNSSEPHLHFQLMDRAVPAAAAGIPFRWEGVAIRPGDADPTRSVKPVSETVTDGLPGNGQVFTAVPSPSTGGV